MKIIKATKVIKKVNLIALIFCIWNIAIQSAPVIENYNISVATGELMIRQCFPEDDGSWRIVGDVQPPQTSWDAPSSGIFILKLVPAANNPDSLVVSYYKEWFEKGKFGFKDNDGNVMKLSFTGIGSWYKKQNGNLVTIECAPSFQVFGYNGLVVPFVFEFDANTGNVIYEFVDKSWIKDDGELRLDEHGIPLYLPNLPIHIFPDKSFIVFNTSSNIKYAT